MLFNKLISFFYKYLNIDNNYIKINNFEFEILNNSKKSESDFEITTNNDRWSYALKFQLNKNETNSFIAGIEIEITQGEIEIITTSDLDISNNKTSKRLSKGKYNEQIEINSNFKNLIFRNYYKSESKFKITSFILTKKKAFDMSNEFKEYLPLLIKDQEVNLNEIINKRNIKLQNISEFKLIKSAYEYQIDLDEIFNDTKGKVLIKNLKHKINLLEKFDYNLLPIKFKENGYGDNEYFKGFLKQSTIRVYHTLLCLDYFKMENKKVLEVGSLFGFFSSVLKDLGNDVTAFDRYNDFNGALENFCSDMKNQNINVIQSSEDKEDKDFEKLEKFDVIICMAVIEHIPHTPKYFLEKLRSKLKNGGVLIIDTPNLTRLENRINLNNDISTFQNINSQFNTDIPWEGHHREFTMNELIYILKELKFSNIYNKRFDYHIFGKDRINQNEIHELSKKLIDDTMLDTNFVAGQYKY
tara:strand:- start:183 stop:1592 length:1410 start_codon:yes stop_codon:yes gene_type:complete